MTGDEESYHFFGAFFASILAIIITCMMSIISIDDAGIPRFGQRSQSLRTDTHTCPTATKSEIGNE